MCFGLQCQPFCPDSTLHLVDCFDPFGHFVNVVIPGRVSRPALFFEFNMLQTHALSIRPNSHMCPSCFFPYLPPSLPALFVFHSGLDAYNFLAACTEPEKSVCSNQLARIEITHGSSRRKWLCIKKQKYINWGLWHRVGGTRGLRWGRERERQS